MRLPRSLFRNIVLWYTLCVTVVFACFTWMLYAEIEQGERHSFDALLIARANLLFTRLCHVNGNIEEDPETPLAESSETGVTTTSFGVFDTNWLPLFVSIPWCHIHWSTAIVNQVKLAQRTDAGKAYYGTTTDKRNHEFRFAIVRDLVRALPERLGNRTGAIAPLPVYVVYASWYEPIDQYLTAQKTRLIAFAVLAWLVILGVGMGVAQWGLEPIRRLTRAAQAITPDDARSRLPVDQLPPELHQLARGLNEAFNRLGAALAAERTFTASAAHELRSPLAGISARLDSLQRAAPPGAGAQTGLAQVHADLDRLAKLSGQLLLLARLDRAAAGEEFPRTMVNVADIVADAADFCRAKAELAGVAIAVAVQGGEQVYGHEEWLLRAVYNVIENAVKYSPPGTAVQVRIEHTADNRRVLVSVIDHGPGVPPAERGRIFERFYRGARAGAKEGTGLGLAIVADVIKAHRGEVFVSDIPNGAGTDCTLIIPRNLPA